MRLRLFGCGVALAGAVLLTGGAASDAGPTTRQGDDACVVADLIDDALLAEFATELDEFGADADEVAAMLDSLGDLPCPAPGGGARLEGDCLGVIVSLGKSGNVIDLAIDADPDGAPMDVMASLDSGESVRAFTKSNPFRVDVDGAVVYVGTAGDPGDGPRDHSWSVSAFGIDLDSGHGDNDEGRNGQAGTFDLGAKLPAPAKINALIQVSGRLDSANGVSCSGAGYIETTGGLPLADGIGVVAILGAGLGALFTARPTRIVRR